MRPQRIEPGPGQESVWDYPRPPASAPTDAHVVVAYDGITIADTRSAIRVLETSQPPAFYIPRHDVQMDLLAPALGRSFREWKGEAAYFDLAGTSLEQVGWTYEHPTDEFESISHHLAFYAQKLQCSVDGEIVDPNEGSFYGGWITSKVVGPFKGSPGVVLVVADRFRIGCVVRKGFVRCRFGDAAAAGPGRCGPSRASRT